MMIKLTCNCQEQNPAGTCGIKAEKEARQANAGIRKDGSLSPIPQINQNTTNNQIDACQLPLNINWQSLHFSYQWWENGNLKFMLQNCKSTKSQHLK